MIEIQSVLPFELKWEDSVLLLSTIMVCYAFQIKQRRKMLFMKFVANSFYGLYFFLIGGYAGAAAVAIATLGGFFQIITPDEKLEKTFPLRFMMAAILSICGVSILANNMVDSYPFISVIISRFSEILGSTKMMRIGFLLSALPWIIYNFDNSFYLAAIMHSIIAISQIIGILRNEKRVVVT